MWGSGFVLTLAGFVWNVRAAAGWQCEWKVCVTLVCDVLRLSLQTILVFFMTVGQKADAGRAGRVPLPFSSAGACKQLEDHKWYDALQSGFQRSRSTQTSSQQTPPPHLSGSVLDRFPSYLTGRTFGAAVNNMSETYDHVVHLKAQCWDPLYLAYVCSVLELFSVLSLLRRWHPALCFL